MTVIIILVNGPFYHHTRSLSLVTVFGLRSIVITIATPDLYWLVFARFYLFHSFISNLHVIDVKQASCRQHVVGSYFCNTLCQVSGLGSLIHLHLNPRNALRFAIFSLIVYN